MAISSTEEGVQSHGGGIKRIVHRAFAAAGLEVRRRHKAVLTEPNPIRPWRNDAAFRELADEIRGRTLVDDSRLFILYNFARHIRSLPGEVAEIGVYKGGTAKFLGRLLADSGKQVHLFDTFGGMPETDPERDWHKAGDFNDTTLAGVQGFLGDTPRVHFHQGFFPATADPIKGDRFALVHVDVDIYRSVLDCCKFFYERMTPGGVMVFDDYGFTTCPGAKLAVDEFFASVPEQPVYLPTGQAVVVRLPAER
jgi:O-methyltransferase